jgi:hypothetical protein
MSRIISRRRSRENENSRSNLSNHSGGFVEMGENFVMCIGTEAEKINIPVDLVSVNFFIRYTLRSR